MKSRSTSLGESPRTASVLSSSFVAALLAACGNGTATESAFATVHGTITGHIVPTTDAISSVATTSFSQNGTTETSTTALIFITNESDTCGVVSGRHNPPNATTLNLIVSANGGSIQPGKYLVGGGYTPVQSAYWQTSASFAIEDASCNATTTAQATEGWITVTTISSSVIEGSFDITMSYADHLTGTFQAPICPGFSIVGGTPVKCGS
jgi:hypothetical protein